MKVSGFTFIRNAIHFDFPVKEAIQSILPLCDEIVVAVGKSDDATLEYIQTIDPSKIKIFETVWDDSLREGGQVLAVETDKALSQIDKDSDWAFYIQGDEVIHEKYHETILDGMQKWKDDDRVDGLLFHYLHFYGSYDYVGSAQTWYPNEIRIIRPNAGIYSYRDAQGFRKGNNLKLQVKPIEAFVYHYGYVRDPEVMMKKVREFSKLWRDDEAAKKYAGDKPNFDFEDKIDVLSKFEGSHPKLMSDRINRKNWNFEYDLSFNHQPITKKIKALIERFYGIRIGYKNYKIF